MTRPATVCSQADLHYFPASGTGPEDVTVVSCDIRNGREAALPGWEACGFELRNLPSAVSNWDDDEEIRRVHYAEVAALARSLTGCDVASVSDHIRRNPEQAARHADYAPIQFVHSDFADSYGEGLKQFMLRDTPEARETLKLARLAEADLRAAKRIVILQTWRNVGPARMDLPIAFCDARTVPRASIRPFEVPNYADSGVPFDTLAIAEPSPPDAHHWYTFPELQIDEVVLFRTFDSERVASGEPYWTPHSAFRDPEVEPGQPSRRSVELRAACFFF